MILERCPACPTNERCELVDPIDRTFHPVFFSFPASSFTYPNLSDKSNVASSLYSFDVRHNYFRGWFYWNTVALRTLSNSGKREDRL